MPCSYDISQMKIVFEEGRPDGYWHAVVSLHPFSSSEFCGPDFEVEVTLNGGGVSKARTKIARNLFAR